MDECGVAVGGDGVGSDHFCFRVKAEATALEERLEPC